MQRLTWIIARRRERTLSGELLLVAASSTTKGSENRDGVSAGLTDWFRL